MTQDKPLKMTVCKKCGTKFFVRDPTPGPDRGEMRVHETAPPSDKNHLVVAINCPACKHPHFAEFNVTLD
jgi:hypothetical protein